MIYLLPQNTHNMKLFYSLLFSLTLSITVTGQTEISALFVGNSYTYVNNLPEVIKEIANSKGDVFMHQSHTPGGATLSQHASSISLQNQLLEEEWDYVILQGQSQNPSFPPSQVANDVYPFAESLSNDIRIANTCSKPVFFMTWGRENGDTQNCEFYEPLCTYEGMQERLIESYTEMAEMNNSLLAPVGIAWKNIRATYPTINLYSSDGSHPSKNGTYLSACVFYTLLFNETPFNSYIPDGISPSDAVLIQEVAYNATLENNTDYSLNLEVNASYEIEGEELHLYNLSQNYDTIQWIGISQNLISYEDTLIINIGDFTGDYEISLMASTACTTASLNLLINDLTIYEKEELNYLYPNPSKGIINYKNDQQPLAITVYNSLGECVYKEKKPKANKWDFSHFKEGIYIIEFTLKNDDKKQLKWLKKN